MRVTVAGLRPSCAAVNTLERCFFFMQPSVVLHAAKLSKFARAAGSFASPNAVHSAACFFSFVVHNIVGVFSTLEVALTPSLDWFLNQGWLLRRKLRLFVWVARFEPGMDQGWPLQTLVIIPILILRISDSDVFGQIRSWHREWCLYQSQILIWHCKA